MKREPITRIGQRQEWLVIPTGSEFGAYAWIPLNISVQDLKMIRDSLDLWEKRIATKYDFDDEPERGELSSQYAAMKEEGGDKPRVTEETIDGQRVVTYHKPIRFTTEKEGGEG